MNWGTKIIVGLATFMLFIIGSSIYMVSKDSDSLIDDDYYEKGLAYDAVYDRKQNLANNHAKPFISVENDTLLITFKSVGNKGEIVFKRPSDGAMDKKIPFFTASNLYKLPISTFSKGNWSLELTWSSQAQNYIDNQSLFLQ